jgi:putative drug exporter of the RND superfamily
MSKQRGPMTTLTRWVLGHRKLVVTLWVALALAGVAAMGPANRSFQQQFTLPGTESFAANHQIAETYGSGGDSAPLVPVVSLPAGRTVDSPGVTAQLARALARIRDAVPHSRVASYASTHDRGFVSANGRTTFALVYIPATGGINPGQSEARAAQAAVNGMSVGGAPVRVTGLDALRAGAADGGKSDGASMAAETLIAGVGALLVLAFVFASWMAVVPVLMAIVAIPTTFLAVWPLAAMTDVSVIVKFLIALVGLAIAIDYALLVVVRWREERQRGAGRDEAVVAAMEHAGKAVVFSGSTVAISLLALVALPVPFLRSIGIAGMLIPVVSVTVAITLLPVVLATVGPRLDRRHTHREDRPSRGWTAWSHIVVRHRWSAAIVSTAVLAGLVVAATTIQLGNPQAESLAQSGPARVALGQLVHAGIGTGPLSPFDTLVRRGNPARVAATLNDVEGVHAVIAPAAWRRGGSSLIAVIPAQDGNSPAGRATLGRIRAATGDDVITGGQAAQSADFLDTVYSNVPLVIALIAALTFLLLARAFRSVIIPLKAVLLNLLSVGAAWGLMVLVWQHGWGSQAIWGIQATHAINVEMPIVVFAFLFGISMDYQVFILSRIHRRRRHRGHRPHRPSRHQRRPHPRPRLRCHERRPRNRSQDVCHRAWRRHSARRYADPRSPGPGHRRPTRPLELVAALARGSRAARRPSSGPGLARRASDWRPARRMCSEWTSPDPCSSGALSRVARVANAPDWHRSREAARAAPAASFDRRGARRAGVTVLAERRHSPSKPLGNPRAGATANA